MLQDIQQHCTHLAKAFRPFQHLLGTITATTLHDYLCQEFPDPSVLQRFTPASDQQANRAIPYDPILHIVSGNTPHAALQSALRGLLIGATNHLKLPRTGLPEIHELHQRLPASYLSKLTLHQSLDATQLLEEARTIIAIGADSTIQSIHQQLSPHQRFLAHGHKLSIAIADPCHLDSTLCDAIARDISQFDQQGCLSLQTLYLRTSHSTDGPDMAPLQHAAKRLAQALQSYNTDHPRTPSSLHQSGNIQNLRATHRYLAANHPDRYALHHSQGNTHWTVLVHPEPTLTPSPLGRTLSIRPWHPELTPENYGSEIHHLSTVALPPSKLNTSPTTILLEHASRLPAHRICSIGDMQSPPLTWHHDGYPSLQSLVSWQNLHYPLQSQIQSRTTPAP